MQNTYKYVYIYHIYTETFTCLQFQRDILGICLLLLRQSFGLKMSPKMADAATVSRALSRIVRSLHGLLENCSACIMSIHKFSAKISSFALWLCIDLYLGFLHLLSQLIYT